MYNYELWFCTNLFLSSLLFMFMFLFFYLLLFIHFNFVLYFIFIASLEPKALNGVLCVFLGSSLNINKEHEQDKANKTNNICLALNIIIVTLNVVISAFDLKDVHGNTASED